MLKLILLAVLIYVLAGLYLYLKQRDMLYFPTAENNAVNAEALWLDTQNERIKIWKINGGDNAIIYFGGNAEAVEANVGNFKRIFNDYTVYLVNYRGYGGSSGSPSEQALFEDALAIYDFIQPNHASINAIGRSLGSGVAAYLSVKRDMDKLILITPYDSLKNVAQDLYPAFPVKWLMKDAFDSLSLADSITSQTMILIAENDQIIPYKHSENLLNAFNKNRVESHILAGSDHNDISFHADFSILLSKFMQPLTDSSLIP